MVARASILTIPLATLSLLTACSGATTSQLTAPESVRCEITLSTPPQLPSEGALTTLRLETSRDCAWSASASAGWVQLSPREGQGAGVIGAAVSPNPATQPRTAVITVNGRTWVLSQAAAPPPPAEPPAASAPSVPPAPGSPAAPSPEPPAPSPPSTKPVGQEPGNDDDGDDGGDENSGRGGGPGRGGGRGNG